MLRLAYKTSGPHHSPGPSPSHSSSIPGPCQCARRKQQSAQVFQSLLPTWGRGKAPGPALAVGTIWEVSQQMKDLPLFLSLCLLNR